MFFTALKKVLFTYQLTTTASIMNIASPNFISTPPQKKHTEGYKLNKIHKSWEDLKRLEEWIYISATKSDWQQVTSLCKKRQAASAQHFSNYPVCPETAFFYKQRLNEHLSAEDTIHLIRKAAVKNSLHIVH